MLLVCLSNFKPIIWITNLAASILHEILRKDVLCDIETGPWSCAFCVAIAFYLKPVQSNGVHIENRTSCSRFSDSGPRCVNQLTNIYRMSLIAEMKPTWCQGIVMMIYSCNQPILYLWNGFWKLSTLSEAIVLCLYECVLRWNNRICIFKFILLDFLAILLRQSLPS